MGIIIDFDEVRKMAAELLVAVVMIALYGLVFDSGVLMRSTRPFIQGGDFLGFNL